jgi:hypothetical protein
MISSLRQINERFGIELIECDLSTELGLRELSILNFFMWPNILDGILAKINKILNGTL